LKTLGFGGTCKVKLGLDTNSNKHVAVKIMKDDLDDDVLKYVKTEVEALAALQHPNILR
jgi:serine/threonine protein kinase